MNHRCEIFGSKVPDVILTYALIYPSNFNQKGYVEIKTNYILHHQIPDMQVCIRVSFVNVLVLLIICAQIL